MSDVQIIRNYPYNMKEYGYLGDVTQILFDNNLKFWGRMKDAIWNQYKARPVNNFGSDAELWEAMIKFSDAVKTVVIDKNGRELGPQPPFDLVPWKVHVASHPAASRVVVRAICGPRHMLYINMDARYKATYGDVDLVRVVEQMVQDGLLTEERRYVRTGEAPPEGEGQQNDKKRAREEVQQDDDKKKARQEEVQQDDEEKRARQEEVNSTRRREVRNMWV